MNVTDELLIALGPPRVPGLVREWTEQSKRLLLVVRDDGDVDVQLHVATQPRRPLEAHFVIPDGEEREAAASIGRFVTDVLDERLWFGLDSRLLGGAYGWLRPENMPTRVRPGTVRSWRGTYDR